MTIKIPHPKDFWTGVLFLVSGLAAVYLIRDLPMGHAGKMGPAYFPTVLGGLLALIGVIAIIRGLISEGEAIARFYLKEVVVVSLAVVLFGVLIRSAGLIPAIAALVLVSSYASMHFSWRASVLSSILMSVFAVLLFVKLLGLPIPILTIAGFTW